MLEQIKLLDDQNTCVVCVFAIINLMPIAATSENLPKSKRGNGLCKPRVFFLQSGTALPVAAIYTVDLSQESAPVLVQLPEHIIQR